MANKLYGAVETAVTFTDTTGDYAITLNNLSYAAGRVSARADKGTGSQSTLFKVFAQFQFDTAPVEGETVDIYIAESDGTNEAGNVGSSDAAVSDADILKNLTYVGSVTAESASADTDFQAWFTTRIYLRYYSIVVWNSSAADNLQATNNINKIIVVPVPPEVQ